MEYVYLLYVVYIYLYIYIYINFFFLMHKSFLLLGVEKYVLQVVKIAHVGDVCGYKAIHLSAVPSFE